MTTAVSRTDASIVAPPPQSAARQTLDQDDFFKLMSAQLQAQDPLKPMDASQFLGQIAQFSTVSGIQSLNTSFASLAESLTANQALQGAALVGREVQVPGDTAALGESGPLSASALLPADGRVTVTVRDAAGATLREIAVGQRAAGTVDFTWDGLDARGRRAAPGNYTLDARLTTADGNAEAVATAITSPVTAVRLTSQGLQLEVAGAGSVPLASVIQIR